MLLLSVACYGTQLSFHSRLSKHNLNCYFSLLRYMLTDHLRRTHGGDFLRAAAEAEAARQQKKGVGSTGGGGLAIVSIVSGSAQGEQVSAEAEAWSNDEEDAEEKVVLLGEGTSAEGGWVANGRSGEESADGGAGAERDGSEGDEVVAVSEPPEGDAVEEVGEVMFIGVDEDDATAVSDEEVDKDKGEDRESPSPEGKEEAEEAEIPKESEEVETEAAPAAEDKKSE